MRLKEYLDDLNEMGGELDLESGFVITKKVMKKMKKKYRTFEEFIKNLEVKAKSLHSELTDNDRRSVKSAWESI